MREDSEFARSDLFYSFPSSRGILFVDFYSVLLWTPLTRVNKSLFFLSQAQRFQALCFKSSKPHFIRVASENRSSLKTDPWDFWVFCVRTIARTLVLTWPYLSPFFRLAKTVFNSVSSKFGCIADLCAQRNFIFLLEAWSIHVFNWSWEHDPLVEKHSF